MIKARQDNDVTDHTGVIYAKNEIELSWSIEQDAVYHEKQTRKQSDRLYMFGLHKIQY